MFGFLRPHGGDQRYRQAYARCCSFQRLFYGVGSQMFLSYEAVFLYLLAIDAGAIAGPASDAHVCCRLKTSRLLLRDKDTRHAKFCASVGVLLLWTKLQDDIRDDRSVLAQFLAWRMKPKIRQARQYFQALDPTFSDFINDCIDDHLRLEQKAIPLPIDQYANPIAAAFAHLFATYAKLFGDRRDKMVIILSEIGDRVGRAMLACDCANDWYRDRQRCTYNPLETEADIPRAITFARQQLSQAGWLCHDLFSTDSLCAKVLLGSFTRAGTRTFRDAADRGLAAKLRQLRRQGRLIRRGDCDCGGGGCDACGCEGCSGPDFDASGPDCCAACCEPLFCCGTPARTKTPKTKEQQDTPLIGMQGQTVGPLNPAGIVRIGGREFPAKSDGPWIDDGENVIVIRQDSFGVVVRRQA